MRSGLQCLAAAPGQSRSGGRYCQPTVRTDRWPRSRGGALKLAGRLWDLSQTALSVRVVCAVLLVFRLGGVCLLVRSGSAAGAVTKPSRLGCSMIMGRNGQLLPETTHDHGLSPKYLTVSRSEGGFDHEVARWAGRTVVRLIAHGSIGKNAPSSRSPAMRVACVPSVWSRGDAKTVTQPSPASGS